MFQMLNIILFIIPLLAAAEDYYQLLGVKKVAKWTDQFSKASVQSLNSSIFSQYVSMWHCWQISKHAFHVSYMFNCSATPNVFDANNRDTRKCKPEPGKSNLQRFFSFVFSECRQPGDPKGVQEAGSEAAPGQERRRGWTFADLGFSFLKTLGSHGFLWFQDAHEKFLKINRAYEVLKDEEARKK